MAPLPATGANRMMYVAASFLAAIVLLLSEVQQVRTQSNTWVKCANTTYEYRYVTGLTRNYWGANTYCKDTFPGSTIPKPLNSQEDYCIFKVKPTVTAWLGFRLSNGAWRTADTNTPISYKNWADGQPDNPGSQKCISMWYNPPKRIGDTWDSLQCGSQERVVCQRKVNVTCSFRSKTLQNGITTGYSLIYPGNITYNCSRGYYIAEQNAESVTSIVSVCQISGLWSSQEPSCTGVMCLAPPLARANSSIAAQNLVYPGTATYQCYSGYYLAGQTNQNLSSTTLECQSDKSWPGMPPTCLRVNCTALMPVTNSDLSLTLDFQYTSVASFGCLPGYHISGLGMRDTEFNMTCRSNRTWSAEPPACDPIQCAKLASMLQDGQVQSFGEDYSTNRTYRCQPGYYISDSGNFSVTELTMYCLANGSWSSSVPLCASVTCANLSSVLQDGEVQSFGQEYSSNRTYTCRPGYYIEESGNFTVTELTMHCLSDGYWSTSAPLCALVTCANLSSALQDGEVQSFGQEYSSNRTYSCRPGYYIEESGNFTVTELTMHCLSDGYWSTSAPLCAPVMCQNLSSTLDNGQVELFGELYNSNMTYTCQRGYYIADSGNFSVTELTMYCLLDGVWSTAVPLCERVTCANLSSTLQSGEVQTFGEDYGSNRTYTCQPGFYISDSGDFLFTEVTMYCLIDGWWSIDVPLCDAVLCANLSTTLPYGEVQSFGEEYGSNRTYTCRPGYYIGESGNFTTTDLTAYCQIDGVWSTGVKIPSCDAVICASLSSTLQNGQIVNFGESYESNRTYTCHPGYYIADSGDFSVTELTMYCLVDGLWSTAVPLCEPVFCQQPITNLTDGAVKGNNVTFGEQYTYSCDRGFYIDGGPVTITRSTIRCQSNAMWSGPSPTCSAVRCESLTASLTNGTASYLALPSNRSGAVIVYMCWPGFYIANATTKSVVSRAVSCQLDALWNDTVPTCISDGSYCPSPMNILNGKLGVSNGLRLQSMATYSCLTGYALMGNSQQACQKNKTWTGTAPACINVDECSTRVDTCNRVNGSCLDSTGSYSCACLPGYTGDGRTCTVVCSEPCLAGQGYCTAPDHCDCVRGYSGAICQNLWPQVKFLGNIAISLTTTQPTSFSVTDGDYHPGRCAAACFQSGFIFAGMSDGIDCVCTNSDVSKIASVANLPIPCPGAVSYNCGDNTSISFYQMQLLPPFKASISPASSGTLFQSATFFALERFSLDMRCTVAAGSQPLVYDWQKDGQKKGDNPVLRVPTVRSTESGAYVCKVSHPGIPTSPNYTLRTSIFARANVEVQVPPHVFVQATSVQVAEGRSLNVTCNATWSSANRFTWQRVNPQTGVATDLPSRATVNTITGDLFIGRVLQVDGGTYRCTANDSTIVFPQSRTSTVDVTLTVTDGDACAGECRANASRCTRITGQCQCAAGYTGNGYTACADIDECRTSPCASGSTCLNVAGSYRCAAECVPGSALAPCTGSEETSAAFGGLGIPGIAGIGGGFVLIILAVILIIVLRQKRRKSRVHRIQSNSSELHLVALHHGGKGSGGSQYSDTTSPDQETPHNTQWGNGRKGSMGKSQWAAAAHHAGNDNSIRLVSGVINPLSQEYDTVVRAEQLDAGKPSVAACDTYDVLQRDRAHGESLANDGGVAETSNQDMLRGTTGGIYARLNEAPSSGNGDEYNVLSRPATGTGDNAPGDRIPVMDGDEYNVIGHRMSAAGDTGEYDVLDRRRPATHSQQKLPRSGEDEDMYDKLNAGAPAAIVPRTASHHTAHQSSYEPMAASQASSTEQQATTDRPHSIATRSGAIPKRKRINDRNQDAPRKQPDGVQAQVDATPFTTIDGATAAAGASVLSDRRGARAGYVNAEIVSEQERSNTAAARVVYDDVADSEDMAHTPVFSEKDATVTVTEKRKSQNVSGSAFKTESAATIGNTQPDVQRRTPARRPSKGRQGQSASKQRVGAGSGETAAPPSTRPAMKPRPQTGEAKPSAAKTDSGGGKIVIPSRKRTPLS